MPTSDPIQEVALLLGAHYNLLYVVSTDEARTLAGLRAAAADKRAAREVVTWSVTEGFVRADATGKARVDGESVTNAVDAAMTIRREACEDRKRGRLFVMLDLHAQLRGEDFVLVRALRDLARDLQDSETTVAILAPDLVLPQDLQAVATVVDWPMPAPAEIEHVLDVCLGPWAGKVEFAGGARQDAVEACRGLVVPEIANVVSRSLMERGSVDLNVLLSAKRQIVRRTGMLDIEESTWGLDEVGGLSGIKTWVRGRHAAFSPEAAAYGLTPPRGMLLLGPPGVGKTLMARTVAQEWGQPLVRFDIGKLFGSLVGESESRTREALKIIESVAPCTVLIDELEKGLSQGATAGDGGTSARVFGSILSWMQDRTAPCFIVATGNSGARCLPPELLRKGRFDEIFFVDLPRQDEREAILRVHLTRRGRGAALEKLSTEALAGRLDGFSGAEIEQVVVESMHAAFADGAREVEDKDVLAASSTVVPLSRTMGPEIRELRDWAETRCRPAAEAVVDSPDATAARAQRVHAARAES